MFETLDKKATIQDYECLPEGAPYQLIGGELIMSPSPSFFHQRIQYRLATALTAFAERHKLGIIVGSPLDVFFTDEDIYQPDLIFIRADRARNLQKDKLRIVPDLVVEVLSPSNAYYDFTRKKEMYCARGVEEYWIIDPEQETVDVMIKHGEFYQTQRFLKQGASLESNMFPGFQMPLSELFAF
ncbi:MAG TPA: Uma2 family endonuclease [Candidatus Kapabacteria bacterium]|jgi:Uma2 family endonuclease